jgi:ketosteroid isomerase-like protein
MVFFSSRQAIVAAALISVTAIGIPMVSAKTSNTNARASVQSTYNKINAAFSKKDITTATSYFTPDYVSINAKGERTDLAGFRQYYTSLFGRFNIDLTANKTTIKQFAVKDNGAEVFTEQYTEGKVALINKVIIYQTARSIWKNTPEGWRLKESKILSNRTTFNGKIVPM